MAPAPQGYGAVPEDPEAGRVMMAEAQPAPRARRHRTLFLAVVGILALTAVVVARRANANSHGSALAMIDGEDDAMKQSNANGHGASSMIDGEDDEMKQGNANGHGSKSAKLFVDVAESTSSPSATPGDSWHQHKASTSCVSDEDCSNKYLCTQGSCVPYQPDTFAAGRSKGVGVDKSSKISPDDDTKKTTQKQNGGSHTSGVASVKSTSAENDDATGALIDGEDDEMKQANANGHGSALAMIDGEDDAMKQSNANGHGASSMVDGEDDEMKQGNANGHGAAASKAANSKWDDDNPISVTSLDDDNQNQVNSDGGNGGHIPTSVSSGSTTTRVSSAKVGEGADGESTPPGSGDKHAPGWHQHKASTSCTSDNDCSDKYLCEQGSCVPYQPDTSIGH